MSFRSRLICVHLPRIPVIGDGQQQIQPVHISDVVATVLRSLSASTARQTLDIVGTETVSFSEWLLTMRRAQGLQDTRFLHVPFALVMAASHAGRYFNPLLQPENLRMLQTGYWADSGPLTKFMGRLPLKVETSLFFADVAPAGSAS